VENWEVTGLRATGSHDILVEGAFVPTRHTVVLPLQGHGPAPGPHYVPAALLLAFVTQGAHALGVARGALDAFTELAQRTTRTGAAQALGEQPTVRERVGRAEAELAAARAYLYGAAADVWKALQAGATPPPLQMRHLRLAITHAITAAVPIVDAVYSLAGAAAIRMGGPLERAFRDIHAAAAHQQASPSQFEEVGRALLSRA
jgi:alkylation response protein AidB-like acyl-CoA dehydrogenase